MNDIDHFWEEAPTRLRDLHLSYKSALTGVDTAEAPPEFRDAVDALIYESRMLIAYRSSDIQPTESFNRPLLQSVNGSIGKVVDNLLQERERIIDAVMAHRNGRSH